MRKVSSQGKDVLNMPGHNSNRIVLVLNSYYLLDWCHFYIMVPYTLVLGNLLKIKMNVWISQCDVNKLSYIFLLFFAGTIKDSG